MATGMTNRQYRQFALGCVALGGIGLFAGLLEMRVEYILLGSACFFLPFLYRAAVILASKWVYVADDEESHFEVLKPPPQDAPTARWASDEELRAKKLFGQDQRLPLGRAGSGASLFGLEHEGHVISFAPDPATATDRIAMPNLLLYEGSIVVTDPGGELFKRTARRRRALGQRVVVIDPQRKVADTTHSFNPLTLASDEYLARMEYCAHLADFLLAPSYLPGASVKTRKLARSLLQSFIGYVLLKNTKAQHLMAEVAKLLHVPSHRFSQLLQEMMAQRTVDGKVENTAFELLDIAEDTRGEIVDACRKAVVCFRDANVNASVNRDDVKVEELLGSGTRMTIYLVGELGAEGQMAGYTRFMLGAIVHQLRQKTRPGYRKNKPAGSAHKAPAAWGGKPPPGVLILNTLADDLGRFRQMERYFRDRSFPAMSMWNVFSGAGGFLDNCEEWSFVLGSCDALQILGVSGGYDADWVSRLLGLSVFKTEERSKDGPTVVRADNRPILSSDEVSRLTTSEAVMFVRDVPPVKLRALDAQTDEDLKGLCDRRAF